MIQKYVDAYVDDFKSGRIDVNEERKELFEYLEHEIEPRVKSG